MSAANVSDFLETFTARREQCRALLELSRQQHELIGNDDYDRLLVVLGQKQRILVRLEEMKTRHDDFVTQWKSHRGTLDPETRDDCDHILAETETILLELIGEENDSTKQIIRRRDAAHSQLRLLADGQHVNRAYHDSLAPATNRYLDVNR
jgi:hypothetical protein